MRSRLWVFVVGGVAAVAIVAALAYWFVVLPQRAQSPAPVASAPVATPSVVAATPSASAPAAVAPAASPSAQASAAEPTPSVASTPAFDIVRIEPSGEAVVAGRGAPGAQVALEDDGKTIGDAAADSAGQFVILPSPLAPGSHPLRLSAKVGETAPQVSKVVVVEVAATPAAVAAAPATPAAPTPSPQPSVAAAAKLTPAVAAPTPVAEATPTPAPTPVASAAAAPTAPAASGSPEATIAVAVTNVRPVDPAGLEAFGSAPPGAHVRLRLNNAVLAEVVADPNGAWRLTIGRGVTPGDYVLEAAVVDGAGAVLARAESPFIYPQPVAVALAAPAASPTSSASPQAAASPAPPPLATSAPLALANPNPAPTPPTSAGEPSPTAAASPPSAATAAVEPSPTAAASPPLAAAAAVHPSPGETAAAAAPTPAATSTPAASAAPTAPARAASVAPAPAPSAAAPEPPPAASETSVASPAHAVVPEVRTYMVVKGDNLWDLAIKYYGDGLRFAAIYSANSSQIHDPNLIYIGQIFVVPQKEETTNPAAAR